MRKIGTVENEEAARRFVGFLVASEISAHADVADDGQILIWVEDEDRLEDARASLLAFQEDPHAPRFLAASKEADRKLREKHAADAAFKRKIHDRKRISRNAWIQAVPVTRLLILASVLATMFGGLGSGAPLTQWLSITAYNIVDGHLTYLRGLPEIWHGQLWRLFTPMFLHASMVAGGLGLLHIIFNMLWLMDLGGMIERVQGGRRLLLKVLAFSGISNLCQYAVAGPAFGGMSGVVFGLLGYCWVRGRQDLTSGLFVSPQTMFMMVFWFFLGFSGAMPQMANAAHGGGLAAGVLWGYVSATWVNRRR